MFCDDSFLPILILLLCGCCDGGASPLGGGRCRGEKSTILAMCLSILLLCCDREPDGPPLI